MSNFEQLKSILTSSPKNIIITTHFRPDADALGSSLAMKGYLEKLNHRVTVVTPSSYPHFLFWMQGNDQVLNYEIDKEEADLKIDQADLIFCLDFSCLDRIADLRPKIEASLAFKAMIDHHIDPEHFADFELWSTQAAAAAELVYEFIESMGHQHLIDIPIGECIYAGIMTDTGSFRFPSTTKRVHLIIAELIEIGVDNGKVHRLVYDDNTLNRLRFLGFALSERLVVMDEYKTAFFEISEEDQESFETRTGDTEGIVNYALSMNGIVFSAFFSEKEDGVKISFRSKGDFRANEFAKKHFNGGGHKNAAGGRSTESLDNTVKSFQNLLPLYQDELDKCHKTLNL